MSFRGPLSYLQLQLQRHSRFLLPREMAIPSWSVQRSFSHLKFDCFLARSPSSALVPTFFWEGSPTKIAYKEKLVPLCYLSTGGPRSGCQPPVDPIARFALWLCEAQRWLRCLRQVSCLGWPKSMRGEHLECLFPGSAVCLKWGVCSCRL